MIDITVANIMDDENKSSKEDDAKKQQAKSLVNDLIKSILQTLKEEVERELSEKFGKSVLLQMDAIEIDGHLKLIV